MSAPAASSVFPPPTLRASAGWVFCVVLATALLSLLVLPPASRVLPAFEFPASLPVTEPGSGSAGSLLGVTVDIVGAGGWHLPATYRYHYLPADGTAAADVDILATYMVSPRTDARRMPELYATSPWCSPEELDKTWTIRATQHDGESGRHWLEVRDRQGVYLVTRIAPDGRCTSTAEQLENNRSGAWKSRLWTLLRWPFSAKPEVDQRAVWVRMTVNQHVDGTPRTLEETRRLWEAVLSAMSDQVRDSLGKS